MRIKIIQNLIDRIRHKKIFVPLPDIEDVDVTNKIICIGDSHVNFFSGNENISFRHFKNGINNCDDKLKEFATFHLGPALAYNLDKYNTTTKAREKIEFLIQEGYINSASTLLLSFGEIDMRAHVVKQTKKQKIPMEKILENIAKNYLKVTEILPSGCNIYLWAPIACGSATDRRKMPTYGTKEDINRATEIFTRILKQYAKEKNIEVLSIFYDLIDKDYNTKQEYYSPDGAHLGQSAWKFADKELMKIKQYRMFKQTENTAQQSNSFA